MPPLNVILALLLKVRVRRYEGRLVRCVGFEDLAGNAPPDFLYASGKRNRYNPSGISCVYFAEDERTASAEYARRLGRFVFPPKATYYAEVKLRKIIDLEDHHVLRALGLDEKDLKTSWQSRQKTTKTQLLGRAVSMQHEISAIRYPSDAARAQKFGGYNLVIFEDAVQSPDSVKILGPTKRPLQVWP